MSINRSLCCPVFDVGEHQLITTRWTGELFSEDEHLTVWFLDTQNDPAIWHKAVLVLSP